MSDLVIEQRVARCAPIAEIDPLLARLFASRGVKDKAQLDLSLQSLHPPAALAQITRAATRLQTALKEQQKLIIIGDFDADGATATTLAVSLLTALGARHVEYLVPNRFEFGYGLTPEIVALAIAESGDEKPDVIITVDNGISSLRGVEVANGEGVDVIITDHHLPGAELPDAYAIVNPNSPGCDFPSKALAGVGVIFYLLAELRRLLSEAGWFVEQGIEKPNLGQWLDLVALGTVADVVPLDQNNRLLVHQGLMRMRRGRARPGIRALAEVAKRDMATCTAEDLGFAIGPRLNAAGRLEDMAIGIKCLLASDMNEARSYAVALDELNRARREIQQSMVQEARLMAAGCKVADGQDFGICLFQEDWHQGVVGIVAGQVRESHHRPVIAFAPAGDVAPDELKGSARSIAGLHIRDVIDEIATANPGLIERFGGHAMAAGLSLKRRHYPRFAKAFNQTVKNTVTEDQLREVIVTDGVLPEASHNLKTALLLRDSCPWGQAFPAPSFDGVFVLQSRRQLVERHERWVLKMGDLVVDAIYFNYPYDAQGAPGVNARLRLVYRLSINDYRDLQTLQLMVEHMEAID